MVRLLVSTFTCQANFRKGFAVVGEYDDPKIMEAQRAAFEQMLSWLKSH